jgi:hypothetical protein
MAKRPPPETTRGELEEMIVQLRAKKAEGFLVNEVWIVEQQPHPRKNGELHWAVLRLPLDAQGRDKLLTDGRRVFGKGSGHYDADEQFHINLAAQKNRLILKRAFKPLSSRVTGVRVIEVP